jgi:hypothetical protein
MQTSRDKTETDFDKGFEDGAMDIAVRGTSYAYIFGHGLGLDVNDEWEKLEKYRSRVYEAGLRALGLSTKHTQSP